MSNISDATAQAHPAEAQTVTVSFCRPDRRTPLDQADNALLDSESGRTLCGLPAQSGRQSAFRRRVATRGLHRAPSWTPNAPGLGVVMGALDREGRSRRRRQRFALSTRFRALKSIRRYESGRQTPRSPTRPLR